MNNQSALLDHTAEESVKKIIHQLKTKCNLQLEKLQEMNNELLREKEKNRKLEQEIAELKMKKVNDISSSQEQEKEENELAVFINSCCRIIRRIQEENMFIPYKNYTKNSARYCKVEKNLFDSYLEEDLQADKNTFFDYCIDFAIIKSDDKRKYVWSDNQDKPIRIYFINKTLVKMLSGDLVDIE